MENRLEKIEIKILKYFGNNIKCYKKLHEYTINCGNKKYIEIKFGKLPFFEVILYGDFDMDKKYFLYDKKTDKYDLFKKNDGNYTMEFSLDKKVFIIRRFSDFKKIFNAFCGFSTLFCEKISKNNYIKYSEKTLSILRENEIEFKIITKPIAINDVVKFKKVFKLDFINFEKIKNIINNKEILGK